MWTRRLLDCFQQMWNDKVQMKLVRESNAYAQWIDPKTNLPKGGQVKLRSIICEECHSFTGSCAYMAVRNQPSINQDYWSTQADGPYNEIVANTTSRTRFLYLLKCLYADPKGSLCTDKSDLRYDPKGQIRLLIDTLVKNFQKAWNALPYLCILACSVTKFVLNTKATDKSLLGLPQHAFDSGARVVTRLITAWEDMFYMCVMDNFCTRSTLFEDRLRSGFSAEGTIRHRISDQLELAKQRCAQVSEGRSE